MLRKISEANSSLTINRDEVTTEGYGIPVAYRGAELPPKNADAEVSVRGDNVKHSREEIATVRIGYAARHNDIVGIVHRWRDQFDGHRE
jgi:hypothetical protein